MQSQLAAGKADTNQRRAVPAWALSAVVHGVIFLVAALGLRGVSQGLPDEAPRNVGIALAEVSESGEMEYFSEEKAAPLSGGESREPAESESGDSLGIAAALPSAASEESLISPDIDLPGQPEAGIGESSELLVAASATGGGRRLILPGSDDSAFIAQEMADRIARRPSGPVGKVSLFGSTAASGRTFVFVIDRSKSMGEEGYGGLHAAQKELHKQLKSLAPQHRFQIIAYHHKPVYLLGKRDLLPATPENIDSILPYFDGLAAFGATEHEMALLAALRLKPDAVFFLTDGGDPYLNANQIDRIAERAGKATTIHCIEFGFNAAPEKDNFMQRLAARCGGGYGYMNMRKRN